MIRCFECIIRAQSHKRGPHVRPGADRMYMKSRQWKCLSTFLSFLSPISFSTRREMIKCITVCLYSGVFATCRIKSLSINFHAVGKHWRTFTGNNLFEVWTKPIQHWIDVPFFFSFIKHPKTAGSMSVNWKTCVARPEVLYPRIMQRSYIPKGYASVSHSCRLMSASFENSFRP